MNTVKPKKKQRRKVVKEAASVDPKELNALRNDLARQQRVINNLERNNKYLRDRVSNLEHRVSAADRILTSLQNAVNTFSRILR